MAVRNRTAVGSSEWMGAHGKGLQRSRRPARGGNFKRAHEIAEGFVSGWQVWIVLAALLLVAEMFAPGFWLDRL